jgi:hypothetical protein
MKASGFHSSVAGLGRPGTARRSAGSRVADALLNVAGEAERKEARALEAATASQSR